MIVGLEFLERTVLLSRVRHLLVICRPLDNRSKCRPVGQTSSTDAGAGRFHGCKLTEERAKVKELFQATGPVRERRGRQRRAKGMADEIRRTIHRLP
jgi:hypothetical protein